MPKIDWLKVGFWGGLVVFTLTVCGLTFVGAAYLLGLLP